MKYRTVIELISEAENSNEALDIAGEFLRGNLDGGVEMRCYSKPFKSYLFLKIGISILFITVIANLTLIKSLSNESFSSVSLKNASAVQPPLKTYQSEKFKETWQEERDKKVIEQIKN